MLALYMRNVAVKSKSATGWGRITFHNLKFDEKTKVTAIKNISILCKKRVTGFIYLCFKLSSFKR